MEIPKTIAGKSLLAALGLLIILGVGWRLIPHIPNFAPIGAIALLAGSVLTKRHTLLLLLTIMLITDSIIGFYTGFMWTWISLGLVISIGIAIKKMPFVMKTGVGAIGASIVFFIVSNFGVWLTSGMYTPTLAGLMTCYTLAIPFLGATLASNFLFGSILFGIVSFLKQVQRVSAGSFRYVCMHHGNS